MTTINVAITPFGQIIGCGPLPLVGIPGTLLFDGSTVTVSAPQVVPVQPLASQVLNVTLNNQPCAIKLYFKEIMIALASDVPVVPPEYGPVNPLFMDLYAGSPLALIVGGVLCQNKNRIVRNSYLGFVGDLAFVDTQPPSGTDGDDPNADELGSRFLLTYWKDLT